MFTRNRIYISEHEQKRMLDYQIVIGGAGLGGVIAECALRLGFCDFHLIDGDLVELSNLNRQNFTSDDIGKPKVEALAKRLRSINPNAKIKTTNTYINRNNIHEILSGGDIAVNALDFSSDMPFVFDRVCVENNIPVLHPYNLGWHACVFVMLSEASLLENLVEEPENAEMRILDFIIDSLRLKMIDADYLEDLKIKYSEESDQQPTPQLAVASYHVAALCARILYDYVQDKSVKVFPEFYHSLQKKEYSYMF